MELFQIIFPVYFNPQTKYDNMKSIYYITFLLFGVVSCRQNPNVREPISYDERNSSLVYATDSVYRFIEKYKGTLPCADCPGIITEITFINDSLIYRESNTYIDRKTTNVLTGSYTTDRGYKSDDDATVYVLDDNKPGNERWFLKLNDSTLLMLDQKEEIIDSSIRHKLFKIQ
jgi:copper homeostasis protein (lipoprotein)